MTNTAKTLLKMLLHGDLHEDDLDKYLNLDSVSIKRNLKLLNDTLISKKLGSLKKIDKYYTIIDKTSNFSTYFSEIDLLSQKERIDILCIRLLLDGEINLEKMKIQLDLSRTTISADFKILKNYLNKNSIEISSKIFKGVFVVDNFNSNIGFILCEKFITLFVNKNFLTKYQHELLEIINVLDKNEFYKSYSKIVQEFNLITSIYTFYALYSMRCIEILNPNCILPTNELKDHPQFDKIFNRLDELDLKFSYNFKLFVVGVIVRIKYIPLFNSKLEENFNHFTHSLQSMFELNTMEKIELSKVLLTKYKLGYLNYRYNSFNVSKFDRIQKKVKLTNALEKIISKSDTIMLYQDIHILSDLILEYFSNKEYSEDFKILFILRTVNSDYCKNIFTKIKVLYPKIEILLDSGLNLKYGNTVDFTHYNLVISEFKEKKLENFVLVGVINLKEILAILDMYILDKILLKINDKNRRLLTVEINL
ncbi:MAG: hypothetical protein ACRCZ2_13850 [Fusobacteriaceae bacterium]